MITRNDKYSKNKSTFLFNNKKTSLVVRRFYVFFANFELFPNLI